MTFNEQPTASGQEVAVARKELERRIAEAAQTALRDPSREREARMRILALLLHPSACVVPEAIRKFERGGTKFPTVEHEQIAAYIDTVIERRVLGASQAQEGEFRPPVSLEVLLSSSSPFAWGDSFAYSCVRGGVKEVTRSRRRSSSLGFDEHMEIGSIDAADQQKSAEDVYLQHQRIGVIARVEDRLDELESRKASKFERKRAMADALRTIMDIPAAAVPSTAQRRWLLAVLETPDGVEDVRESLRAHRDLVSGRPSHDQLTVDDRLLDLWVDYTAEAAHTLSIAPLRVIRLIVSDAASFPPRPREADRVNLRKLLRGMCTRPGWPTMVRRLEAAWVAEFFAARTERASVDRRTDEEAETERAEAAKDWQSVSLEAVRFSGSPLRAARLATSDDVAAWLERRFAEANSVQPVTKAA